MLHELLKLRFFKRTSPTFLAATKRDGGFLNPVGAREAIGYSGSTLMDSKPTTISGDRNQGDLIPKGGVVSCQILT